ncbi:MAG TPA: hypothetical protein VK177_06070 [Flavobacteriales bacterium]|nr:hypothetical protein [Flavobacteriales bacterium]
MKSLSLYLLAVVLLLSSCSPKVAYTSYLASKYQLTEDELKKVQFYTSEDIVLYTRESSSKTGTENGTIVVSSSEAENQILIKKGTPGVMLKQVGTDKVYISFEVGDNKFLVFGSTGQREPFKLQAESWDGGRGKLSYDGKTYYASTLSGTAHLLVSIKKFQKRKSDQKVVEGRKVE